MPIVAVEINSPRFDTPWRAVLNLVGVGLWIVAVVSVIVLRRRGNRISTWDWVAVFVSIAVDGVYIPLGPILWLAGRVVDHERAKPADGTRGG